LFHVTLQAPELLSWFLNFWKPAHSWTNQCTRPPPAAMHSKTDILRNS